MKLVDVKRTKADKKATESEYKDPINQDDYPWGLNIRLDNATVQKLGLGDLDADESVRLYADAFVTEDSVTKRNGKTVRTVALQITKLAVVQSEDDDSTASAMYGGK